MSSPEAIKYNTVPTTLPELLEFHTSQFSHRNALNIKRGDTWTGIGSQDLLPIVRRISLGLYSIGVRPGDRVAILSDNSPLWILSDFSITILGAATVPIYTTQVATQIEYILSDAGVKVFLISNKELYDRVRSIFSHIPFARIILFGSFDSGEKILTLDELQSRGDALGKTNPELFDSLREKIKPDTTASIIYTSGTTGEPKGVVLTHNNLTSNAIDASSVSEWFPDSDIALSFLPLSHIFEKTIINIYLYRGIPVYFAESVEVLGQNLLEISPTVMSTVPRMLEKVYDKIKLKGTDLTGLKRRLFDWSIKLANTYDHSGKNSLWYSFQRKIVSVLVFSKWRKAVGGKIRFIISGGAPLPAWLGRIYIAAGIPIVQGYGLTETSPVIAVNYIKRNRLGSVGPLIPNVQVQIATDGEILVKGPNVMKEFFNAPEATREIFSDGWLCSGDLGYVDNDGFLFITGRKKDLIKKSSGKFVAPGSIEISLSESRFVEFSVIIGEGRKFIVALIFPNFPNLSEWAKKKGLRVTVPADLLNLPEVIAMYQKEVDTVNNDINPWERIVKFLLIETEPTILTGDLTPTLKMRRRIIEGKYKDRIDSIYDAFEHLHDVHW